MAPAPRSDERSEDRVQRLQRLQDLLVSRAPLDQLVDGHHTVLIGVDEVEYPFDVVLGGGLLHHGRRVAAQHVVDGGHHLQHLGLGHQPVAVLVVEAEDPLQLLLH